MADDKKCKRCGACKECGAAPASIVYVYTQPYWYTQPTPATKWPYNGSATYTMTTASGGTCG